MCIGIKNLQSPSVSSFSFPYSKITSWDVCMKNIKMLDSDDEKCGCMSLSKEHESYEVI